MTYFAFDNEYRMRGHLYLVGIDEAGRGPLAGPLFAAAVILPPRFNDERIKDSKALTSEALNDLSNLIKEVALSYKIVSISPEDIDTLNIYQATKVAMSEALMGLSSEYHFVLTDAMPLGSLSVGHESIIKGDSQSLSIAAASILAKVARDNVMLELDEKYPLYDFKNNKGYPTKSHLAALELYGPIKGIHRFSYKPVQNIINKQIKLF